jgi:hypothetical protein
LKNYAEMPGDNINAIVALLWLKKKILGRESPSF